MRVYKFPKDIFRNVLDHFANLDVEMFSCTLQGDEYIAECSDNFPEEQLEHLDMVEVK